MVSMKTNLKTTGYKEKQVKDQKSKCMDKDVFNYWNGMVEWNGGME